MDDIDVFPQGDGSEVWKKRKEVGQRSRGSYCGKWYVVHLEAGGQPTYADPVWGMTVAYDNDLMAHTHESYA